MVERQDRNSRYRERDQAIIKMWASGMSAKDIFIAVKKTWPNIRMSVNVVYNLSQRLKVSREKDEKYEFKNESNG